MVRAVILRNDYVLKSKPYNLRDGDFGLYAITPYGVTKDGYSLVKCGYTTNFIKRFEGTYHNALAPSGYFILAIMRVKAPRGETKENYLRRLEKILFSKLILRKDVIHHKPLTRVNVSEWFFVKISTLHEIFDEVAEDYVDENTKSNKLILNQLTISDVRKFNNMELNKKGRHLNTHMVVHIQPMKEKDKDLEQVIKYIRKVKEKKRYNLRNKERINYKE